MSQAEVNRLRDDMQVLWAKQAPPMKDSTKQPKSKVAKQKGLLHQASASTSPNDPLVSCPRYTTYAPSLALPTPTIKQTALVF